MTNYPAEFAPSWWDFPLSTAMKIAWIALGMVTWSPRMWATHHTTCFDLPSAWWAACHAWEYCQEEYNAQP